MGPTQNNVERAKLLFLQHGGTMRTRQSIDLGIHPRTLYEMRDAGTLDRLGRGLYRLSDLPGLRDPDLVTVALKVPQGVVCLISALAFHEITTQIPHEIYLAVNRGCTRPRIEYPPLRMFWFSGDAFSEGVEAHIRDEVPVRVYGPEKTLADCFKYRNKTGMDSVVEALKLYKQRKPIKVTELLRYARICRVERVMTPYLEAIL